MMPQPMVLDPSRSYDVSISFEEGNIEYYILEVHLTSEGAQKVNDYIMEKLPRYFIGARNEE